MAPKTPASGRAMNLRPRPTQQPEDNDQDTTEVAQSPGPSYTATQQDDQEELITRLRAQIAALTAMLPETQPVQTIKRDTSITPSTSLS